jgi:molybdopterin molybdotransferase
MLEDSDIQRIARLTPLADVLASFDLSIRPVAPREEALAKAVGLALAADIKAASGHPQATLALRDGYAVRADETLDASSYAPAPLTGAPARIDTGEPLPEGADAVATLDMVQTRGAQAEALAVVAPGEGTLAPDADAAAGLKLRLSGAALRRIDVALLADFGIERVMVRQPRVRVVCTSPGAVAKSAARFLGSAIEHECGQAISGDMTLEAALNDDSADMVVAIGGTGSGRADASVETLAKQGRVTVHGVAISPGETAAFGTSGDRPVLLLPGRIDAAIAAWLTMGVPLIDRLEGSSEGSDPSTSTKLTRKVASPIGLVEIVPVRLTKHGAEPIASGYWPLAPLANTDGWILVPANSEGLQAGSEVVIRPWP